MHSHALHVLDAPAADHYRPCAAKQTFHKFSDRNFFYFIPVLSALPGVVQFTDG